MTIPFPSPLARLTAVRHGRSLANELFARGPRAASALREFSDRTVPLVALGEQQAAATGRALAATWPAERPDLVVCSPYLRTRETWRLMAEAAPGAAELPVEYDERLRDRENGIFELVPVKSIKEIAAEEHERRLRDGAWSYRPPGGENFADVTLRVADLMRDLGAALPGRHVLLVAHDGVIVALRHALAGIGDPAPDGSEEVGNASISRWEQHDGHLRLLELGAARHLDGIG